MLGLVLFIVFAVFIQNRMQKTADLFSQEIKQLSTVFENHQRKQALNKLSTVGNSLLVIVWMPVRLRLFSATTPKIIIGRLGGKSRPRLPDEVNNPKENFSG